MNTNETSSFATLRVNILPLELSRIFKFINDECETEHKYSLRGEKGVILSTPKKIKFIEIASAELSKNGYFQIIFKIFTKVDVFSDPDQQAGIVVTPSKVLTDLLELTGFSVYPDEEEFFPAPEKVLQIADEDLSDELTQIIGENPPEEIPQITDKNLQPVKDKSKLKKILPSFNGPFALGSC